MEHISKENIIKLLQREKLDLSPTHYRLSIPIINRLYVKMKKGIRFDDIKVFENCIIDGHHRYISALLAQIELGRVKSLKTSATIIYKWQEVDFVYEEWDTVEKINRMNKIDADFNNISLKEIIDLTS